MDKKLDTSDWSQAKIDGYNYGRKAQGLPIIKLYRPWQVKVFYGMMFLLYTSFCVTRCAGRAMHEEADIFGVMAGLNAAGYLFLYWDQKKNNLIILIVTALLMSFFTWILPLITLALTLIVILVRWNGKRSEWSQMWFDI